MVAKTPADALKREGTIREILPPWHVLQEKLQKGNAPAPVGDQDEVVNRAAQEALAAQEAANASWRVPADSVDVPPSSGVRMSEPGQAPYAIDTPAPALRPTPIPDSPLSFKVYTLADLERRSDAPVAMRSSLANLDLTSSRRSLRWQRVGVALRAFVTASIAWLAIKGPRPSVKVALRQPFDAVGDELQVAVESIDWKRLGIASGIVIGATLTLLFAVLTAAELTDDLRSPGSGSRMTTAEVSGIPARTPLDQHGVKPATQMAAMGAQRVVPEPIVIEPPAATVIGDIDDVDAFEETPAPSVKKAAKKAAAKPKTNKLTLRTAPF